MGDIEKDGNTLVVKRIHVTYHLRDPLSPEQGDDAQRVLEFHADFCPVARSIRDSIEITTALEAEVAAQP